MNENWTGKESDVSDTVRVPMEPTAWLKEWSGGSRRVDLHDGVAAWMDESDKTTNAVEEICHLPIMDKHRLQFTYPMALAALDQGANALLDLAKRLDAAEAALKEMKERAESIAECYEEAVESREFWQSSVKRKDALLREALSCCHMESAFAERIRSALAPLPNDPGSENDPFEEAAGQASGSSEHTVDSANPAAAPSAVEEVKSNIFTIPYRDPGPSDATNDREVVDAGLALDLAKRLDSAQFDRDSLNIAYSTAEAALKELAENPNWERAFKERIRRELDGKGE